MNCFYCGAEIGDAILCHHCGADQKPYRQILLVSNVCYNEGLSRAGIRDLSGAAEVLNQSLKYNKYNINARNLLGLVYFEVGETVLALREWVISKNLQPQDNLADQYLEYLQKEGNLSRLDQTAQKFNLALNYCKQGSRDLARIQLKRVISANPKMVKAHQLFALVSIQDGKYEDARKSLSQAAKIDYKNPMTMVYMQEVRAALKSTNSRRKRKKRKDTVDFTDGNDTVILPRSNVFDVLDNAGSGIINVFVGILLGVLACVFLVMPSVKQNMNADAATALVNANEEAANSKSNVNTLQNQVETLTKELEEYTGKADVKTSYEKLLLTENAIAEGDMETAKNASSDINRDLLDSAGQARYDAIMLEVNAQILKENYEAASSAMRSKDYDVAISQFLQVVDINPTYEGGDALYYLAQCYDKNQNYEEALKRYQQFIDMYPRTRRASSAQNAIDKIVNDTGLEAPTPTEGIEVSSSDEVREADREEESSNNSGNTRNTTNSNNSNNASNGTQNRSRSSEQANTATQQTTPSPTEQTAAPTEQPVENNAPVVIPQETAPVEGGM